MNDDLIKGLADKDDEARGFFFYRVSLPGFAKLSDVDFLSIKYQDKGVTGFYWVFHGLSRHWLRLKRLGAFYWVFLPGFAKRSDFNFLSMTCQDESVTGFYWVFHGLTRHWLRLERPRGFTGFSYRVSPNGRTSVFY